MTVYNERKLATIRRIDDIKPIKGADLIECAIIGGWEVVVKKGEFKINDLCVYHEIDSLLPDLPPYGFLIKSKGKEYNESSILKNKNDPKWIANSNLKFRLLTLRLRGQISQGLALPIDIFYNNKDFEPYLKTQYDKENRLNDYIEGIDLTEFLGIYKYEKPIPTCLAGQVKGNYPVWIPKTDQERIQSVWFNDNNRCIIKNSVFCIEEKLDGSSITIYKDKDENVGVTSRNMDLKMDQEGNTFIDSAKRSGIIEWLKEEFPGENIAVRGEMIGPGIQGNPYNLNRVEIYIFDIWLGDRQRYMDPALRFEILCLTDFNQVPYLGKCIISDVESIIEMADGKSKLNKNIYREGLVFKTDDYIGKDIFSFKSISRKFLLSEKT